MSEFDKKAIGQFIKAELKAQGKTQAWLEEVEKNREGAIMGVWKAALEN